VSSEELGLCLAYGVLRYGYCSGGKVKFVGGNWRLGVKVWVIYFSEVCKCFSELEM
jgi:hypothetical protein